MTSRQVDDTAVGMLLEHVQHLPRGARVPDKRQASRSARLALKRAEPCDLWMPLRSFGIGCPYITAPALVCSLA